MSSHIPVIQKIVELLDADSRVVAAWLEGSLARGEGDDLSDIDLWIAVKDRSFQEFINQREQFGAQLGTVIGVLYPKTLDQPDDLDSFLIAFEDQDLTFTLDVDVQKQSRSFRFTKDSPAEECKVLFDKIGVIRYRSYNPEEVEQYAKTVFEFTCNQFWARLPKLYSLIERDLMVEAWNYYRRRLKDLATLYRVLYAPDRIDFGWTSIEQDLPADAVRVLYDLLPRTTQKALRKQLRDLAKQFKKTQLVVGKRVRVEPPTAWAKWVMKQL